MVWLDRDQMPVRFTVVTSVGSGLILAAILGAVRTGISEGAALLWFALTTGGVTAAWALGSAFFRAHKRTKRAFLVTSAFSQKYFLALFVERLHSALDRDGIDLVLKVPDRDYDASAQSHHLSRLLDRRHDYVGGIIVVSDVHRLRADLITFCQKSHLPYLRISSHSTTSTNIRRTPHSSDTTPASLANWPGSGSPNACRAKCARTSSSSPAASTAPGNGAANKSCGPNYPMW